MREKSERIDVRVTPRLLRNVRQLRESGEFPDDSETVRFCIQFTLTMMRILPAVLVESFARSAENGLVDVDSNTEENVFTRSAAEAEEDNRQNVFIPS